MVQNATSRAAQSKRSFKKQKIEGEENDRSNDDSVDDRTTDEEEDQGEDAEDDSDENDESQVEDGDRKKVKNVVDKVQADDEDDDEESGKKTTIAKRRRESKNTTKARGGSNSSNNASNEDENIDNKEDEDEDDNILLSELKRKKMARATRKSTLMKDTLIRNAQNVAAANTISNATSSVQSSKKAPPGKGKASTDNDGESVSSKASSTASSAKNSRRSGSIATNASAGTKRKLGSHGRTSSVSRSSSGPGKAKRGEYYEVFYDDPSAVLKKQPPRRTRPRYEGDFVGEALIYGDSLTWALQHDQFSRLEKPWPELLRARLNEKGFTIVQSNFLERTTVYNDEPMHSFKWNVGTKPEDFNGIRHFGSVFSSHSPKWLMIMLGTHDLKSRVREYAEERGRLGLHKIEDTNKPPSVHGSDSESSSDDENTSDGDEDADTNKDRRDSEDSDMENDSAPQSKAAEQFSSRGAKVKVEDDSTKNRSARGLSGANKSKKPDATISAQDSKNQKRGAVLKRGMKGDGEYVKRKNNHDTASQSSSSSSSSSNSSLEDGEFTFSEQTIAHNCERYIKKAREMYEGHCHEGNLKILFVTPPEVRLTDISRKLGFDEESVRLSKELPKAFARLSRHHDVVVVKPSRAVMKGSVDGIHPTAKGHEVLADLIWTAMQPELPRQTRKPERLNAQRLG